MSHLTAEEAKVPRFSLWYRCAECSGRRIYRIALDVRLSSYGLLEVHHLESLGPELCGWNEVPGPGVGGLFVFKSYNML